jgi:predicted phosphodiesterase
MAKTRIAHSVLVNEILKEFPNTSKRSLGKLLFDRHPLRFRDAEAARETIRRYTGTSGYIADKSKITHITNYSKENPFGLAESKAKVKQIKKIDLTSTEILWLSDIHFPNHDSQALTLALQYGIDHKVNCIILGGDILDNEPFTNHLAPPPSKDDVRNWFEMVDSFLLMLRDKFANCQIIWIEGNHDNWYKRYLMSKAPMLFHDEYYDIRNRLKLDDKKIVWYDQNVILMAGKLQLLHGHTLIRGFFSPVNAARGLFLRAKSSTLIGHVHSTSEHSESNIAGEIVTCYSTGCLCTLAPDYDPHNTKHNQGFAHIKVGVKGHFRVLNKRIIKGEVY